MMHLYERLLGASFAALPASMRDFHTRAHAIAAGTFSVQRARGRLVALAAAAFGLPKPGREVAVVLDVTSLGGTERWRRRFGGVRFNTVQRELGGRLLECAGLVTVAYVVRADAAGLRFASESCRVAGLRLPAFLSPTIEAASLAKGEAWSVDVCVSAPRLGLLVRYGGDVVPAP
jgi:hypothetical protein